MNKPTIGEILAPRPEATPRLYATASHATIQANGAAWGRLGRPVGAGDVWASGLPEALPPAGVGSPCGALAAAVSANDASHPQPRATPWGAAQA